MSPYFIFISNCINHSKGFYVFPQPNTKMREHGFKQKYNPEKNRRKKNENK